MKSFGWAIIGPGRVAHRFAEAVNKTDNTHIAMVQGRDAARSRVFADAWMRDDAAAIATTLNIDDVLNASEVDAVYIASPHAFHADAIRRCLIAGKAVLCEKPLVTDARTAHELIQLSRQQNTFLMEAVWTRFLPIYSVVRDWLQSNKIGAVKSMQSSFCFNAPRDPTTRLFDPAHRMVSPSTGGWLAARYRHLQSQRHAMGNAGRAWTLPGTRADFRERQYGLHRRGSQR
jgi:predicted dehydrogenase